MKKELPPKVQLIIGLILLAVGGFPWLYTPLFFGDRPPTTNEGSGMLGTLIFLFVGLPGLLMTTSALRALRNRRR